MLPTSSATARKGQNATNPPLVYVVLAVLFGQIGSVSAACRNFPSSGSLTVNGVQYCDCGGDRRCDSCCPGYGGPSGSSCSSCGKFSVYIKRLRNAPDKDWHALFSDDSDPCIQINLNGLTCGGTDTKWDNHNPNFYQRISCGCTDKNGQMPSLDIWDNDDHPTSHCTGMQYAENLGSVQLDIGSRSEYDITWSNGMSLTIETTFDTTQCQPLSPRPQPPPPPSPSPPPPRGSLNSGAQNVESSRNGMGGAIAGCVVGGFAALVVTVYSLVFLHKRGRSGDAAPAAAPTNDVQITGGAAVSVAVGIAVPSVPMQVPTEHTYTFNKATAETLCGINMKKSDTDRKDTVVFSLNPAGAAASCGLVVGDTVLSINGMRVTSPDQAATLLKSVEGQVKVCVTRLVTQPASVQVATEQT